MPAKKATQLEVPPITIGRVQITIIGTSPLVCSRPDEKVKQAMLDKQMGKATRAKEAKDPHDCFMRSLYVMPDCTPILHDEDPAKIWAEGRFGMPAIAFKSCAVQAANDAGAQMTVTRRSFHIPGELVEILGDAPVMRQDMLRLPSGVSDIRFRAEFTNWQAKLEVTYNQSTISISQIANLFRLGGFGVGIGEWRPERKGQWGRFTISPDIIDLGTEQA